MNHYIWIIGSKEWHPIILCDEGLRLFEKYAVPIGTGRGIRGKGKRVLNEHRASCDKCSTGKDEE